MVSTMVLGSFKAHETILICPECKNVYDSLKLKKLVPYRCNFGYDVIVYVGISIFLQCRSEDEVYQDLLKNNIKISGSEINYLAKKFIIYLSIAHKESKEKIRNILNQNGGYILHLDSTCESDSPHLMSGLDGISEIVLKNVKIPTEQAEKIIPFLKDIKEAYGSPLALVHDMSKAILKAIKKVFPKTPDYICHMHFLRDIGKDLFQDENDRLRKRLSKHGIQGILRKKIREFHKIFEKNPESISAIVNSLNEEKIQDSIINLMPQVSLYILFLWCLDGKNQGDGYGFPFDRPYLLFYQRLVEIHSILKELKKIKGWKNIFKKNLSYIKILNDLSKVISDPVLKKSSKIMEEKVRVFDKLRKAMRILLPDGHHGLNDNGDKDIKTIEIRVTEFYKWLCNNKSLLRKPGYDKMIIQIKKYWDKLFADPIIVQGQDKKIVIQPQRTNNIMERLFRYCKHKYRKRSGTSPASRNMRAILADTPLVKNLENKDYLEIILDGKESLEDRFAEIDSEIVRHELIKSRQSSEKIPYKIKKIIKQPMLPNTLIAIFSH
jgi:hypothetical protein